MKRLLPVIVVALATFAVIFLLLRESGEDALSSESELGLRGQPR